MMNYELGECDFVVGNQSLTGIDMYWLLFTQDICTLTLIPLENDWRKMRGVDKYITIYDFVKILVLI